MPPAEPIERQLPARPFAPRKFPHLPRLPTVTRVLLLVLGWTLIAIGILGLFLPVLQGMLTLFLGGAILSLVSQTLLDALRYVLRPWPKGWRALLRTRRRIWRWLRLTRH